MAAVTTTSLPLADSKSRSGALEVSKTAATAQKTDFIWEGCVAAKAPNGQWIPVLKPLKLYKSQSGRAYIGTFNCLGINHERVKLENSACPHDSDADEVTYRPKSNFDYAPYGLTKIGTIWVNPDHPIAVNCAQEILKCPPPKATCIIL